jgi:hypothetical protein
MKNSLDELFMSAMVGEKSQMGNYQLMCNLYAIHDTQIDKNV